MDSSSAAQGHGPGCKRHKGDPHNLCQACWALEPDRSQSRWSRFRSWLHDWIGRDNEPMSIESWWELNDSQDPSDALIEEGR